MKNENVNKEAERAKIIVDLAVRAWIWKMGFTMKEYCLIARNN